MANSFQEVNDKRITKIIEAIDVVLNSAGTHNVPEDELEEFLMPIVEHMGLKGQTVQTYSALPHEPAPVVPVDEPKMNHTDQVKISRWVHSVPGHSFKTIVAAAMGRLMDGED